MRTGAAVEVGSSFWAPPAAFGAAVALYTCAVELDRGAVSWSRPLLQLLGMACAAWMLALGAAFALWPQLWSARLCRRRARELCREIEAILKSAELTSDQRLKLQVALEPSRAALQGPFQTQALAPVVLALEAAAAAHRSDRGFWVRELGLGVGKALLLALLVRTVLVEPYRIPTGSMLPTLQVGDQVFVNKLIYGVRIPFTNWIPFVVVRPPNRGDVIVFNNPADPSKDFIKRVVGVPGDTVVVDDEVVVVNGRPQTRALVSAEHVVHNREAGAWYDEHMSLYLETLNGVTHPTLQAIHHPRSGVTEGPYRVPEGHVFVMGDNRDGSTDSRYGLGKGGGVRFVPYGNIKGKAMVVWLSLSYGGILSNLTGGTGLRADRLFLPVL